MKIREILGLLIKAVQRLKADALFRQGLRQGNLHCLQNHVPGFQNRLISRQCEGIQLPRSDADDLPHSSLHIPVFCITPAILPPPGKYRISSRRMHPVINSSIA